MPQAAPAFSTYAPLLTSTGGTLNKLSAAKCPPVPIFLSHSQDNRQLSWTMSTNNPGSEIVTSGKNQDRREFLRIALGATTATVFGAFVKTPSAGFGTNAARADVPAILNSVKNEQPLTGDYKTDANTVLADMRVACTLTRGAPNMDQTVTLVRHEMNDFVALYRRNNKVSGNPSFSTLYTAINTLSGHYANYGNAYPVPEKRKKRLLQQFTEVDRALSRGR